MRHRAGGAFWDAALQELPGSSHTYLYPPVPHRSVANAQLFLWSFCQAATQGSANSGHRDDTPGAGAASWDPPQDLLPPLVHVTNCVNPALWVLWSRTD